MNNQNLQQLIDDCHKTGKKVAVLFCSHVPQEILLAADMIPLRIPYVRGVKDAASRLLPRNVCPVVKNCCDICEDEALKDADLILVMDKGRIIEQGTHEELMKKGGYYAETFHSQYGEIPNELLTEMNAKKGGR